MHCWGSCYVNPRAVRGGCYACKACKPSCGGQHVLRMANVCSLPSHLLPTIHCKLNHRRCARCSSNRQAAARELPAQGRCIRTAVLLWAGLLPQVQCSQVRERYCIHVAAIGCRRLPASGRRQRVRMLAVASCWGNRHAGGTFTTLWPCHTFQHSPAQLHQANGPTCTHCLPGPAKRLPLQHSCIMQSIRRRNKA